MPKDENELGKAGEGWLKVEGNAKGRPRKPLAEVLLGAPRCAPLRLFFLIAHRVPFFNCMKIQRSRHEALVGIALRAGKFTSGLKRIARAESLWK